MRDLPNVFFFKQMQKKEKTNCKKKKIPVKRLGSSTRFAALILEAGGIFFDVLVARSSERMKEFLKMTWSYFGGRTCLWKLSGCWDGVILRDDFTQTNVAYGIILTGFYCQSELEIQRSQTVLLLD